MLKKKLIQIHWFLSSQLGIDLQRLIRFLGRLPSYIFDWRSFRMEFKGKMSIVPCVHDKYDEGGFTKSEYFWQDLMVARWINISRPDRHIDVGSRVDGFVAHVASFREIEVFDVRPVSPQIPGITFRQADFMRQRTASETHLNSDYCDSISCLHAIEHFGLGRYGDPIDSQGYKKGIANLSAMLKTEGTLYLSTPIGAPRVEFNANRIFDPEEIIDVAKNYNLRIIELYIINPTRTGLMPIDISADELRELRRQHYNLGIFVFKKMNN